MDRRSTPPLRTGQASMRFDAAPRRALVPRRGGPLSRPSRASPPFDRDAPPYAESKTNILCAQYILMMGSSNHWGPNQRAHLRHALPRPTLSPATRPMRDFAFPGTGGVCPLPRRRAEFPETNKDLLSGPSSRRSSRRHRPEPRERKRTLAEAMTVPLLGMKGTRGARGH